MYNITFISTIHKEIGKCNPLELFKIIEKINPEVIFLEASDETYTEYQHYLFSTYQVFNSKLEIAAIQHYSLNNIFEYIPLLEIGLSDAYDRKHKLVCANKEWQKLIGYFLSLATKQGFKFLNSDENIKLQEEMRVFESTIINDKILDQDFNEDIDNYEDSMIHNIYSYCENNDFNSAIFMCGAAHRKSIIKKIEEFNSQKNTKLNWKVFGN